MSAHFRPVTKSGSPNLRWARKAEMSGKPLSEANAANLFRTFLEFLSAQPSGSGTEDIEVLFFSETLGGVSLSGEEAKRYRILIDQLVEGFSSRRHFTKETITRFIQAGILAVIVPAQTTTLEQRIKNAVEKFRKDLGTPLQQWSVFFPVRGFEVEKRSFTFGRVEFLPTKTRAAEELRRGVRTIVATSPAVPTKKAARDTTLEVLGEVLDGNSLARVDVSAFDAQGALAVARHSAETAASLLNFFTSVLVQPKPARVVIGRVTTDRISGALVLLPGQTVHGIGAEREWVTRATSGHLRSPLAKRTKFAWISKLLAADTTNAVHRRLLTSASWAGQAACQVHLRHAFLLNAIALETLLMPTRSESELSYRLRVRAAHLLGTTPAGRRSVQREVGRLYGIRSKIVHTGTENISEKDARTMQVIVTTAILNCFCDARLRRTDISDEQFEEWFEARTVR